MQIRMYCTARPERTGSGDVWSEVQGRTEIAELSDPADEVGKGVGRDMGMSIPANKERVNAARKRSSAGWVRDLSLL